MKKLIALLMIVSVVSCKKQTVNDSVVTDQSLKHGIVKVEISSNGISNHNLITKKDTINNYVNNRVIFDNSDNTTIYYLNTNLDNGWYRIYALSNSDSVVKVNSDSFVKLTVTNEFGTVLIDSARFASTILSKAWQTGIQFDFQVK